MTTVEEECNQAFSRLMMPVDPVITNKLITLANSLDLNVTTIADHWETYVVNNRLPTRGPQEADFGKFTMFIKDELQKKARKGPQKKGRRVLPGPVITSAVPQQDDRMDIEPPDVSLVPIKTDRTQRNVEVFNETLGRVVPAADRKIKVEWADCPNNVQSHYRHMWNRVERTTSVLDQRINDLGDILLQKSKYGEQTVFHLPSQAPVVAVGMICNDGEASGLNRSSTVLQSSARLTGASERIKLDMMDCSALEVFPGQIVAIKGSNLYGKRLLIREIYTDCKSKEQPVTSPESGIRAFPEGGIRVMAANGPFTANEDLDYHPYHDLLKQANNTKPDVLILMGPFVDANHPSIKSGTLERSYQDIFDEFLKHLKQVRYQVVLVPSPRDIHHHSVLPQPPFDHHQFGLPNFDHDFPHVSLVSNPCTLKINGISFGLSSSDVLKHLQTDGLSLAEANVPKDPKPLQMARHLIQQQSYYPLWPGHIQPNDATNNTSLCPSELAKLSMPYTPDIMLFSSLFGPFVANVDGVLCVNPSKLVRKDGTYAVLDIHPPFDLVAPTPVVERTKVEITTI